MDKRDIVARIVGRRIGLFDRVNRSVEFVQERSRFFADAPRFANRFAMHRWISAELADGPLTYLEFGVWRGDSFRLWLSLNGHEESRFVGFDTFTGLPENWTADQPQGTFSTNGLAPELADRRARFVPGLFQSTLYGFLDEAPLKGTLVVHIDCDLYSSTLYLLSVLDRHFTVGTRLIFDDFHSLEHEYAAWRDYRRAFPRAWLPLASTERCLQAAVCLP
jgi:O-methyltransferase